MTAILMNLFLYHSHLEDQVNNYFYCIGNEINLPRKDKYLVQTRSQVRSSGIRLPEIHGANKGLDPHMQPGKQKSFPIQTVYKGMPPLIPFLKPRIGQGRARLRRKVNSTSANNTIALSAANSTNNKA